MGNKQSSDAQDKLKLEEHAALWDQFDTLWKNFLEQNCILAKDKYVPIKILIQAFTFYLQNSKEFMDKFDSYNSKLYNKYNTISHIVNVWIYQLLDHNPNLTISSGFSTEMNPEAKYQQRHYYYYMNFVDERTVIGLSVERFQKN